MATITKIERAKQLRFKKGALDSMSYEDMRSVLWTIEEACQNVRYILDKDSLIDFLDGDEEEAFEIQMAFTDLEAKAESLREMIEEDWDLPEYFDDCTVALIGNRYNVMGYDTVEEDYFSLCRYEGDLATTESAKRIMRWSKAELIAKIGQCVGILIAFLDLKQKFDYLSATLDILQNENNSILNTIKEIEKAFDSEDEDAFNRLSELLPDRVWLE